MKKRVLSLLSCALILVTCLYPRPSHAIAPALAAAPEVGYLLAELAVTCGITVWVADMFDPVCERIWDNLTPEQRDTLTTAANSGRWVLDAGTGLYKHVVSVSNDLWASVKGVVDSLFDAGENVLTEGNTVTVLPYDTFDTGYVPLSSLLPCTLYVNQLPYVSERYTFAGDTVTIESTSKIGTKSYITLNGIVSVRAYNTSSQFTITFLDSMGKQVNGSSVGFYYLDHVSYGSSTTVGTVYGDAGVLDNPDWDWENKDTGKKDLPFIPPMKDLPGLPELPGVGASDLIDYDSMKEGLVGKTAEDLINGDVSGVEAGDDSLLGIKGAIASAGAYVVSGVRDLFIPAEASLVSFQDMVTEKLPIIPDLQDWVGDFKNVLNNPTQFSNRFTLDINLGAGGGGKYGHDVINALPTSGYLAYKPLVDDCIVGFVWLVFLWNLYGEIPSIIHGGASALQRTAGIQKLVREDDSE